MKDVVNPTGGAGCVQGRRKNKKGLQMGCDFPCTLTLWEKNFLEKNVWYTVFKAYFPIKKSVGGGRKEAKWCLNWPSALGTLQAPVRLGLWEHGEIIRVVYSDKVLELS